jgi:hypothetical protein
VYFLIKFSVPKEIKVINKERKYNLYRLSAFCLSKTLSEIPLAVIQPFAYLSVIYWVANLNSVTAFFASLGVLMADVLASNVCGTGIGLPDVNLCNAITCSQLVVISLYPHH